jgi:ABC-2 type transport system permease protein
MNTLRWNLPGYLQQIRAAMQIPMTYRGNWIMHFVHVLLQIYVLRLVWTSVYAGRSDVGGVGLSQLIAYLTLVNLQASIIWPFVSDYIQERVRDGKIAIDLARPIGLIDQLLAYQLGMNLASAPFVFLSLIPAYFVGGLLPPASPLAALFYLISLALAWAITVLLGLLLGLTTFWTIENGGMMMIYQLISQFFAGMMVPLPFFPPVLRTIAGFLPFQSQGFVPIASYLGQIQGIDLISALALQLTWIVLLTLLARLVWARAMRRVVVQGG